LGNILGSVGLLWNKHNCLFFVTQSILKGLKHQ